jgi:hypothetical protein
MPGARTLPIALTLDGQPIAAETLARPAGAHVLTLSTTIDRADLALTLHSTYMGAPGAPTHVLRLQLGPAGRPASIDRHTFADHDHPELSMVTYRPGDCAADHALALIDRLKQLGHRLQIELGDDTIAALQAI